MNQDASIEHVITVNPIFEDTVYINDAVLTDVEFVDAIIINENTVDNCINVKQFVSFIVTILCLSFMLFVLFLFTGGIGYFLTINGGDDPT